MHDSGNFFTFILFFFLILNITTVIKNYKEYKLINKCSS